MTCELFQIKKHISAIQKHFNGMKITCIPSEKVNQSERAIKTIQKNFNNQKTYLLKLGPTLSRSKDSTCNHYVINITS